MAVIKTAVKRRIAVSMIYGGLVLYGIIALTRTPVDLLPDIEMPMISIITAWGGAATEDVEENVTNGMEEQLGTIPYLKHVTSVSRENLSAVNLEFEYGTDLNESANQVRDALGMAEYALPEDVTDPMMFRMSTSFIPVVYLGVLSSSGDIGRYTDLIEQRIADPIRRIPGVASVISINTPVREIHVDVDPNAMANRGLTLQGISDALAAANLAVPLGNIGVSSVDYTLRFPGMFRNLSEIEDTVVGRGSSGELIRLREVATVSLGTTEAREISEVSGQNAALMMVLKQSGENTVRVAEAVRAQFDDMSQTLPDDLHLMMLIDTSEDITTMIGNLKNALLWGGLFVILAVLLFIQRIGPSIIIVLAIPSSLLFTVLLMFLFGYTLNFITLIAMVLAVGMLVDNSIVVLEHIVTRIEKGIPPMKAAMTAPYEVAGAVIASSLTTVAIFAPLIFVSGMVGIMFAELGVVMIVALGSSLVSGLILTPMLAGWWLRGDHGSRLSRAASRMRQVTLAPLRWLTNAYCAVLGWALRHKLVVLGLVVLIMVATGLLSRNVKIDFSTKMDGQQVSMTVSLPRGTDLSVTEGVGRRIIELIEQQPEVELYFLRAGETASGMITAFGGQEGSHIVEVGALLVPLEERDRYDWEVAETIRAEVASWPEVVNVLVQSSGMDQMFGAGRPVQVRVSGDNLADLEQASGQVLELMNGIDGLVSPSTTSFDSRPELTFEPDRDRSAELGVPIALTGSVLRTALVGSTATRIQYDGDDVDVLLRYAEPYRSRMEDLHRIEVPSVMGQMVPVTAFTELAETTSLLEIRHYDRERTATVDADVFGRPLGDIITDLEQGLAGLQLPPGVHTELGGRIQVQKDMFGDMTTLLLLAVLLVFMVMAAQFESLIDPFVIMFAVPFAFTGTFLALLGFGVVLSMFSFLGLIILVGIVVNNAIVLVDYINLLRRRGLEVYDAIVEAGRSRLRPVLMTAITTICGMMPLATSTGQGGQLWRPIGLAVVGGLTVSTLVTLVLVPVIYRLTEPLRFFTRRKWAQERQAELEASGASTP